MGEAPGRPDLQALADLVAIADWPDDSALSRAVTRAPACPQERSLVVRFGAMPGCGRRAVRLVCGAGRDSSADVTVSLTVPGRSSATGESIM